jgi:hypothetical protein
MVNFALFLGDADCHRAAIRARQQYKGVVNHSLADQSLVGRSLAFS